MHIPSSMLHGAVCPVTAGVAALGVATAGYCAAKSKDKPSAGKFAAVTSLVFALQMLNYPVQNGTSGHLIGAMLAVALMGIPFSILSMAIVLLVQTLVFADGGASALGANVINMSLLAAGAGGYVLRLMAKKGIARQISLAAASLISVVLAAAACSFEVAAAGTISLNKVLPSMLSVHVLIGLGEAVLTVAVYSLLSSCENFWKENEKGIILGSGVLAFFGALFSPLASGFPDGLEWVAGKLSFKEFIGFDFPALFPDYRAVFSHNESLATISAGIIGIAIVFIAAFAVGKLVRLRQQA